MTAKIHIKKYDKKVYVKNHFKESIQRKRKQFGSLYTKKNQSSILNDIQPHFLMKGMFVVCKLYKNIIKILMK